LLLRYLKKIFYNSVAELRLSIFLLEKVYWQKDAGIRKG
jgi:hypothetical protein